MRRIAFIVALSALLPALSHAENAAPFHRLKEKEIRAHIIGKVITDETHWSDYYRKDGTVETMSMGKEETGKWSIKDNELCVVSKSDHDCYEVWQSGNQIELRLDGTGYPYQAVVKEYKEH